MSFNFYTWLFSIYFLYTNIITITKGSCLTLYLTLNSYSQKIKESYNECLHFDIYILVLFV